MFYFSLYDSPNERKEEIQMIDFRNLINERWDPFAECLWIVVNNDVEIDAVFSACEERFAIVSAV